MNQTNKLGMYVAGVTAVLVIAIASIYFGVRFLLSERNALTRTPTTSPTPTPDVSTFIAGEDSDNDELPDLVENLYRTLPNNPDTDADGTSDGEEISLQRDPTIAAPNDSLLEVSASGQVTGAGTYTQKYLATLPDDLSQDDVLSSTRLEAFVEEYKGSLLPDVPVSSIKTNAATGKEAIGAYISAISSTSNTQITPVTSAEIEEAHRLAYSSNQPQPLRDILTKLEANVSALQQIEVPQEAVLIHQELVAASQALVNNVKLLENMQKDFVGGLIGAKNIELLSPIFAQIANDTGTLKEKYQIP